MGAVQSVLCAVPDAVLVLLCSNGYLKRQADGKEGAVVKRMKMEQQGQAGETVLISSSEACTPEGPQGKPRCLTCAQPAASAAGCIISCSSSIF